MNRQQQEAANILLKRVRDALNARGTKTIRSLGICFRCLDSYDGNRKLDKNELKVGLAENGVQLSWNEIDILFAAMDRDRSGTIDFDEFLVAIRGQLNPTRKAIVDQAFKRFDKTGDGKITVDDIRGVYNTKLHPKVKNGQMSENQVLDEFLVNFGDVDRNGQLSYQEWLDYYAAVSASVDNDEHFVLLMKMAWKL
ncbi:unnamed protein product [Paramecium octaurelia]|uniref:EF-hand domain-containing protein n=1 Tax=Paramecium octaurelia TaxID=43137 RepID=A0A8S1S479_PAROT|nr:unnamed protein product [Paramecium octaurelia]